MPAHVMHVLTALALTHAALATRAHAQTCDQDPPVWRMLTLEPRPDLPHDRPLVLTGQLGMPVGLDDVAAALDVQVIDHEGRLVDGQTSPAAAGDDLVWWPERALTVGKHITVQVTPRADSPWADRLQLADTSQVLLVVDSSSRGPDARITAFAPSARIEPAPGRCLAITRCGVCTAVADLPDVMTWQVALNIEVPDGPYAGARHSRLALATSTRAALGLLRATPYQPLTGVGEVQLTLSGGAVDAWPAPTACVAVEINDPSAGALLHETRCLGLPTEPMRPLAQPGPEPSPSCAVSGGGGSSGGALGLCALLLLGAARRRRRLRVNGFAALCALIGGAVVGGGLVGCAPTPEGGQPAPAPSAAPRTPSDAPPAPDAALPDARPDARPDAQPDAAEPDVAEPDAAEPDIVPPGMPTLFRAGPTPPPLFGGTLAVSGDRAVLADADRARVLIANLDRGSVIAEHPARRPWRVAIDAEKRRAYVTLRGEGALLMLDTHTGAELARIPICAAPRGVTLAWDQVHVACAGGLLLSVDPEAAQPIVRHLPLEPDLRDVVFAGGDLHISRFRSAALITVDRLGRIVTRRAPAVRDPARSPRPSAATAAWRTIALDDGWVVMLHQRARIGPPRPGAEIPPLSYYGASGAFGCGGGAVTTELTAFPPVDGPSPAPRVMATLPEAVVALDLVYAEGRLTVAAPGNRESSGWTTATLLDVQPDDPTTWPVCAFPARQVSTAGRTLPRHTAIAHHEGRIIGFERDRPLITRSDAVPLFDLGGPPVVDPGRTLFHMDVGVGVACASCHPEAGEDGHVWSVEGPGPRRTQELRGGLAGTAPFHWAGELHDFEHLLDEVMTRRMGGPPLPANYAAALMDWIDAQPMPTTDRIGGGDPIAGAALFADPVVGCAACHSGPRYADGALYDVGTGGAFETPTLLGVGRRTPLMHDGCAATLGERFDPACGGGEAHGHTAHLEPNQMQDLLAFLRTL